MGHGVIFDFNGTMIFDAAVNRQAWREFLGELIGRDCTDEEFYGRVQGGNGRDLVAYFLGTAGIELPASEVEQLGVQIDAVYRRVLVSRPDIFRLAPGLPEFLDELVARGIPRTIASAAPPENMDLFYEHLGLERIHLLGQSWGGMLAITYLADCQPEGIASAVLSSTLPASWLWAQENRRMARQLPEDQAQALLVPAQKVAEARELALAVAYEL